MKLKVNYFMKIELNKKQYRDLVEFLDLAGYVYGLVGDMVDRKYVSKTNQLEALIDHVLKQAEEFDCEDMMDEFRGRRFANEKMTEKNLDTLFKYNEHIFWEKLIEFMAMKELLGKYKEEELETMEEDDFHEKVSEVEKSFSDEFEANGLRNLKIVRNGMEDFFGFKIGKSSDFDEE